MAENPKISQVKIGSTTYDIIDVNARTAINNNLPNFHSDGASNIASGGVNYDETNHRIHFKFGSTVLSGTPGTITHYSGTAGGAGAFVGIKTILANYGDNAGINGPLVVYSVTLNGFNIKRQTDNASSAVRVNWCIIGWCNKSTNVFSPSISIT